MTFPVLPGSDKSRKKNRKKILGLQVPIEKQNRWFFLGGSVSQAKLSGIMITNNPKTSGYYKTNLLLVHILCPFGSSWSSFQGRRQREKLSHWSATACDGRRQVNVRLLKLLLGSVACRFCSQGEYKVSSQYSSAIYGWIRNITCHTHDHTCISYGMSVKGPDSCLD